jgi:hypothetical protein
MTYRGVEVKVPAFLLSGHRHTEATLPTEEGLVIPCGEAGWTPDEAWK